MTTENKETIKDFHNYLLDLGLNGKMNFYKLFEHDLKTYVLLFGKRFKFLPYYDEVIGFKFNRKDYIKLSDGRKIKGICFVPSCNVLGFMFDDGISIPVNIMTEENYSQIIKNIWIENQHI